VTKDIEELKAAGFFFLFMGLVVKSMAVRKNEDCFTSDGLVRLNDRNDVELPGDDGEKTRETSS
jgi:hypothetical protein